MKNLIFISLLASLFAGCHKEQNDPVSADLKAAYSFNVGSYWIYRDSISGEVDSQYVTQLYNEKIEVNGQHTTDYLHDYMNRQNMNTIVDKNTGIKMFEHFFVVGDANTTQEFYPFVETNLTHIINSIYINNIYYTNIVYIDADNLDYPSKEIYYMDMNIGIIKFQTYHDDNKKKVFELVRYKIVK